MTELVLLAMRGDKDAFAELIGRCEQTMYRIARSYFSEPMDIDDSIAQTVMLCWKNIGGLKRPEYFRTWLCRILINTCKSMLSRKRDCVSLDELPESMQPADRHAKAEGDGFSQLMELADPRYRTVMLLYYGEGFGIREISELTGLPQGTVSSDLMRGRRQLAKRLKEEDLL